MSNDELRDLQAEILAASIEARRKLEPLMRQLEKLNEAERYKAGFYGGAKFLNYDGQRLCLGDTVIIIHKGVELKSTIRYLVPSRSCGVFVGKANSNQTSHWLDLPLSVIQRVIWRRGQL